ncbi:MAG: 1-deoxy-D-xylulose-5-phosphate synthase [Elusimicrobiaceae bacterium]|nr:1-deoxy-D-xylulose-5-phosphate synthase [Elusimicrobiaceae bacterium]
MKILPRISTPQDVRHLRQELLPELCGEIRETIVSTISHTGGHLGSSLGTVEIITALHYVFDTPADKLVFDTGHQAYTHKLLTGRYEKFGTIRQLGGLSGFLKRHESECDSFGAGHASTALSAALGMAAARDQRGGTNKVVAIVSDGCMTGGMAYEALQNAGQLGKDILVLVNDNQMFISNRVGSLGTFLTKLLTKESVQKVEQRMEDFLKRKFETFGDGLVKVARRARVMLFPGMLFEEMGFTYYGPVDGHNVNQLIETLRTVKNIKGPVILHVVTQKGKGYQPAEEKPIAYHGVGIFDKEAGVQNKSEARSAPSYTKVFSNTMLKLAAADEKLTAITAAMPEGTGLDAFRDRYPGRYYDVGIAEEHAVTFAAGLAADGAKPVVALYSSFMQRAYDQAMHDVCLQDLPVVLALDRAGVVGEDGPTHHGVFDYSFLRNIPGMSIIAPKDENELQHALKTAVDCGKPVTVRYPRGAGEGVALDSDLKDLPFGKGEWLRRGRDCTIIAAGNRVCPALRAAESLAGKGLDCGVINIRFIKPLDTAIIEEALTDSSFVVTVEDNVLAGGFGSSVAEYLTAAGRDFRLKMLGIGDEYVTQGKPAQLYSLLGLDDQGIAAATEKFLKNGHTAHTRTSAKEKSKCFQKK